VGSYPYGVAVHPSGSTVYVANELSNTVSVIDTATHTVTDTVPVGSYPYGVAVHPSGSTVYVANELSNTVSVIDTATHTVTDTVPVGSNPFGVAVHPAGRTVYVANAISNTVSVIDTATHTVTATVTVGSLPQAFGLFIGPLPASLNGHVTDQNTGNPINQSLVIALQSPTKMKAKTDGSGTYEIKALSSGDWLVLCWKRGYQFALKKVTLAAGETRMVDFSLKPKANSRDDDIPPEFRDAVNAAPALSAQHKLTTTWGAIKRR
ncbi:carboxypeptidase regulatory-like domain-containing protein, partial [Candidatus Poribacteria bacterium]|nr:carboxypeptidase regulatory-like domain-containing protein [Candidatus Poribacteria bacterium]